MVDTGQIVSLKLKANNHFGIALAEIFQDGNIFIIERFYPTSSITEIDIQSKKIKEEIIGIIYDYGQLFEDNAPESLNKK